MVFEKNIITLPRSFIIGSEIIMLIVWVALAFWSVVLIGSGFLNIGSLFLLDRAYGMTMMILGFLFLYQVIGYVNNTRTVGLTTLVTNFLNKRFPEIIATVVTMIGIAVIVGKNIHFIITDILTLPFVAGSTFSIMFGYFITDNLHIPFGPHIVVFSLWLLQVYWIYIFAKIVVKIIYAFRLRDNID